IHKNPQNLLTLYNHYPIHQKQKHLLQNLQNKNLTPLLITPHSSPHPILNLPIFIPIPTQPLIHSPYFIPHQHLHLIHHYLTNPTPTSIPIILIIHHHPNQLPKSPPPSTHPHPFLHHKKPHNHAPNFHQAFQLFAKQPPHHYTTHPYLSKHIHKEILKLLQKI
ncbi:thioredoxin family protein, partial [Bacillus pumilus]|uniref:thioredoxin family protein n=1 Tax=Bacillus pumilus TaxID=1408 RepID=UPI0011A86B85